MEWTPQDVITLASVAATLAIGLVGFYLNWVGRNDQFRHDERMQRERLRDERARKIGEATFMRLKLADDLIVEADQVWMEVSYTLDPDQPHPAEAVAAVVDDLREAGQTLRQAREEVQWARQLAWSPTMQDKADNADKKIEELIKLLFDTRREFFKARHPDHLEKQLNLLREDKRENALHMASKEARTAVDEIVSEARMLPGSAIS